MNALLQQAGMELWETLRLKLLTKHKDQSSSARHLLLLSRCVDRFPNQSEMRLIPGLWMFSVSDEVFPSFLSLPQQLRE
jgi:hypothetical protein